MKRFFPAISLLICFLGFSVTAIAQNPSHSFDNLYEQLCSVNGEWKTKADLKPVFEQLPPIPESSEQEILKTHLRNVEAYLRSNPPKGLSIIAYNNRIKHLDVLHQYWQSGAFPNNDLFTYRRPFFVGKNKNVCAVGHLLKEDGQQEFVQKVHDEMNTAYIREMEYPEIPLWADLNGFTVDELAWIQPSYGNTVFQDGHELWYEDLGQDQFRIYYGQYFICPDSIRQLTLNSISIKAPACNLDTTLNAHQNWTVLPTEQIPLTCTAGMVSILCTSGSAYNFNRRTVSYTDIDLSGFTCTDFEIYFRGCCRPGGSQLIYVSIPLKKGIQNSSPVFLSPGPIAYPSRGVKWSFSATDPDGDSLSYHLAACKTSDTANFNYPNNFSPQAPMGNWFNYNLDPVTGDFLVELKPGATQSLGLVPVCVEVKEWRNGTQIGTIVRDFTGYMINNPMPVTRPEISIPYQVTGGTLNGQTVEACVGRPLTLFLRGKDSTYSNQVGMTIASPSGNATLRQFGLTTALDTLFGANGTVHAEVTWTPTQPGWHTLQLKMFDDECLLRHFDYLSIPIHVSNGTPSIQVTTQQGPCGAVTLQANGPAGTQYVWTGLGPQPVTGDSIVHQFSGPGNYAYTVTASNPGACTNTIQGTVQVQNQAPAACQLQSTALGCHDIELSATPLNSNAALSYTWSGDGNLNANAGVQDSSLRHTYPGPGTYHYQLLVDDGNGCTFLYQDSITITGTIPVFSVVTQQISCYTFDFAAIPGSGQGGLGFLWSGDGGLDANPDRADSSFSHTYPGPGTWPYTLQVTNQAGCTESFQDSITIGAIQVNLSRSGDTLFASHGISFQWYAGSFAIPGATQSWFHVTIPGMYHVEITDSQGCNGVSDPINVDILTGAMLQNELAFSISPNPSNGIVQVSLTNAGLDQIKWTITDLSGKTLDAGHIDHCNTTCKHRLDLKALPAGVYFLRLEILEQQITHKIMLR